MRLFHEGEGEFVPCVFISIKQRVCFSFHVIQQRFSRWIKPSTTSLLLGTFADVIRGKSELLAENALLRQQLIILRRRIKRPTYRKRDRLLLVLMAMMSRPTYFWLFLVFDTPLEIALYVTLCSKCCYFHGLWCAPAHELLLGNSFKLHGKASGKPRRVWARDHPHRARTPPAPD